MKKNKEKQRIIIEIGKLENKHCDGCRKPFDSGVKSGQYMQWCTSNCEAGKQIRALGTKLEKGEEEMKPVEVTKVDYLKVKEQYPELTEKEVAKKLGIAYPTLWARKKEWGLTPQAKKDEKTAPSPKEELKWKKEYERLETEYKKLQEEKDEQFNNTCSDLEHEVAKLREENDLLKKQLQTRNDELKLSAIKLRNSEAREEQLLKHARELEDTLEVVKTCLKEVL